ncbi:AVN_HP_G0130770.mRNA.1.CDS.1 [Saccharomyces cerevisiae]|nr:AVN_HP_G0130770.mRNA.1.CDS.1 [Saccharomyces cerevisiae]CAI6403239.1 AVN_HP_G0130770.mRNA.1.CDS.1 [Saccharomyces cerevisiae]
MVRLMLTLTPVICVSAAVALSKIFDIYLDFKTSDRKYAVKPAALLAKLIVSGSFIFYLYLFVFHSTWVTRTAYSSPSVVLPSQTPDGKLALIDDFREAYYWLRMRGEREVVGLRIHNGGKKITPLDVPPLDYFDEVFTSENWMVRIYQLKKDDAQGRTLRDVGELTRSSTKTRRSIKRPELGLRV